MPPLRLRQNLHSRVDGHWVINEGSPFQFELGAQERAFYDYFNGKLTFREIGARVAAEQGRSAEWGIRETLRVYGKCEDKMSSITVL